MPGKTFTPAPDQVVPSVISSRLMDGEHPYGLKVLAALDIAVAGYIAIGSDNSIGGPSWWRVLLFWFLIPTLALPVLLVINSSHKRWEVVKSTYGIFLFGPIIFGAAVILIPILFPPFVIWLLWRLFTAKPGDENDRAVLDLTWLDRLIDKISAKWHAFTKR